MYRTTLFVGCTLALALAGCALLQRQSETFPGADIEQVDFSQVECIERADDPEGYLLAICEYVLANEINTSPADPSQFNIIEIWEGVEDSRTVYTVFLDCCGMGDFAVIDAETGEVLRYHLGDY